MKFLPGGDCIDAISQGEIKRAHSARGVNCKPDEDISEGGGEGEGEGG